jgi:hypothetical protein
MQRKRSAPLAALVFGLLAAATAAGCGSGTRTVSAAGEPVPATQASTAPPAATPTGTTTTGAPTGTAGGTAAPTTTHSAPEPAFTEGQKSEQGATAAAAAVRAHGYTPNDTSQYHPDQTLRVLVGTRTGSGDGYGQQAFFFVDGRYVGTDTKEPSASVRLVSQGDTQVTLAYPLYRRNDPLCCPGGGHATVRFQLDNGRLVPLDPIPSAGRTSSLSRY